MTRLHDYVLSAACYKARLFMSLLGVTPEIVAVDYFPGRQHLSPEYLALNPAGDLPILEDGGEIIAGAEPILAHLARRYDTSGTWLPASGRADPWLAFSANDLAPLAQLRLHDLLGLPCDVHASRRAGRKALRRLDDHLADRHIQGEEWLLGSAPSLADIACFPDVALSHDCGIGLEDYPALNLWQRRVRRLPGFISMPGIPDYF